jgi:hypothetical protein
VDELRRFTATGIAPLFDRVLPLCTQLESLFVSASEISINLFTLIPPSLKYLRIQAYNVSRHLGLTSSFAYLALAWWR